MSDSVYLLITLLNKLDLSLEKVAVMVDMEVPSSNPLIREALESPLEKSSRAVLHSLLSFDVRETGTIVGVEQIRDICGVRFIAEEEEAGRRLFANEGGLSSNR